MRHLSRRGFGTLALAGTLDFAVDAAAAQGKIVIGHSQPNLGWPYIAAVTKALELEAKARGVELVTLSANGDIAKQASDIALLVN